MLSFMWYRRLRGGRWCLVNGLMFGKRWVRVSDDCKENVDEDWTAPYGQKLFIAVNEDRNDMSQRIRELTRQLDAVIAERDRMREALVIACGCGKYSNPEKSAETILQRLAERDAIRQKGGTNERRN